MPTPTQRLRATIARANPHTRYGRRLARAAAQALADETGHTVYLQDHDGRHYITDDGRGPFHLGAPWREYHPSAP